MREETVKVFMFDELSEEAKENALNYYRDINVNYPDWNWEILEDFVKELKEQTGLEIEVDEIHWACASRDAHFAINGDNLGSLICRMFEDEVCEFATANKVGAYLAHMGGGICSQRVTDGYDVWFYEDVNKKREEEIRDKVAEIFDTLLDLCRKYHKKIEEAWNELISDESVANAIRANEFEFDVYGNPWR